jgi:hypothetical protein
VTYLTNGLLYNFRVRAKNAVGSGPWATISATPAIPITVPGVPQDLAAAAGDQQATLTWLAPADDGGSAILDYAIQYRTGGGAWTPIDPAASGLIVGALANGTEYEFQVRARNAVGSGSWSASVFATPQTVPGIPLNLAAAAGDQQVTLTWDPPTDDGGSAILDYAYEYRESGGAWSAPVTPAASGVIVGGLTNGLSYEFRVRARNANGSSLWSDPVSATPMTVPGAPTLATATPGNQSVALTWAAPLSDGGESIDDYVVQWSTGACASWTTFADGVSTNLFATVTGLTNGTSYCFQVLAVNAVGTGASSNILSATPINVITVPGTPVLTVVAADEHVHVSWTQPPNGGAPIDGYELCHRRITGPGSPTAWSCQWEPGATNLSEIIGNLTNGRTYEFQVRAHNSVGYGPYSAIVTTTLPATVPGIISNLHEDSDTQTTVSLHWDVPSDGGSAITDYEVQYRRSGTSTWIFFDGGDSTDNHITVTGLTRNTWYEFQVRAVNAVGSGSWSSTFSNQTDY